MNKIKILLVTALLFCMTGYAVHGAAYPDDALQTDNIAAERSAAAALNEAISECVENKVSEFVIPEGNYRFNNDVTDGFVLNGAENLTIDCSNAIFYSEKPKELIVLKNCKNVTLKNFKLDYNPLPYLQGTLTGTDKENRTLTVEFDSDGYTLPDDTWNNASGSLMKFIYFSPDGKELISSRAEYDKTFLEWVAEGTDKFTQIDANTYKIKLSESRGYIFSENSPAGKGVRFAIPWRRSRAVFLFGCENVTIENADIYAYPGYCFNEVYGNGGNVYRNINVVRRPGTDRLLSGNADTLHSSCMVRGPVVENCTWEYAGDDFINIRGYYNVVLKNNGDSLYIAVPWPYGNYGDNQTFGEGDELEFLKYTSAEFKKTASAGVVKIEESGMTVTDAELAESFKNTNGTAIRTGLPMKVLKVTFDGDISGVPEYSLCFSRNRCGGGAVIRNNRFSDNLSRAVLIRGDNAVIIGNTISRTGTASIVIKGDANELEAGLPDNAVIKQNHIYYANNLGGTYDSYRSAAIIANLSQANSRDTTYRGRGIDISDNYIYGCGAYAISMKMYEDSAVYNNKIVKTPAKSVEKKLPLNLSYCDLHIAKNTFDGALAGIDKSDDNTALFTIGADELKPRFLNERVWTSDKNTVYSLYALGRGSGNYRLEISVFNADGNFVKSSALEQPVSLFTVAQMKGNCSHGEKVQLSVYHNGELIKQYYIVE